MRMKWMLIGLGLLTLLLAVSCEAVGGPESAARKAFEEYAQSTGTPYKDARFQTLSNDGTFAIVRITAKLRESAEAPWLEHEAEIECKKVGKQWQYEPWMYFRLTQAEQEKTVSATATAEAEVAATQAARIARETAAAQLRGKIAFVSGSSEGYGIYVMNADGSNVRQITHNPLVESTPTWSPDGTQIAFTRAWVDDALKEWRSAIYVIDVDGSNINRLTDGTAMDSCPTWSPDGTKIAFERHNDTYVMNADGTNLVRLAEGGDLAWSPNGTEILFRPNGIYVMDANGSNVTCLLPPSHHVMAGGTRPAWSPDGAKIAFALIQPEHKKDEDPEIYVMNADGSNLKRLTNNGAWDESPVWSPDGGEIAFERMDENSVPHIYVMNSDGTNETLLIDYWATMPAWSR